MPAPQTGLTGRVEPHIVDDLSAFKLAFRRHAAGVAVVTGRTPDGTPVGFTATSLASLAAVPPLATFNMARVATAWPAVAETTHVLIHLLGARNRALADRLSGPHDDRFTGDHWAPGPLDLPLLNDVPAWMLGRVVERVPVAEAAVVVVQIEDGGLGAPDDALLYHERNYMIPSAPIAP
jgi:flavin reductase (DIM6/NTAB) family NADH-FMN oxidoreductase RutF